MIRYLKRVFVVGILIVFLLLTIGILYNIENNKIDNNKIDNKEMITKYNNIVIIKGKKNTVKCLINNKIMEYKTISYLNKEYDNVVADIKIVNNNIVLIRIKPHKISGKLLSYNGNSLEIDNYGVVKCTEDLKMYGKEENNFINLSDDKLHVGMENISYVLERDKICAIIINNDSYNSKNIRVLIKTSNYKDILHNYIEFKSEDDVELLYVDNARQTSGRSIQENRIEGQVDNLEYTVKKIRANRLIKIKPNSRYFKISNRILVRSKNDRGVILPSVKRGDKNLKYYGQLEFVKLKNGIAIINDIDIEKYLYSVIPSEMPESYGVEALKVQAICARTYAYSHLNNNKYKKYGANIDDSISYQVYNNQKYGKDTIRAVNDTKGKVIKYKGKLANIFYYSTSCGYSSNTKDVFGGNNIEYLVSKKQSVEKNSVYSENIEKEIDTDIYNEKFFRKFILSTDGECFEKNCEWFRWKIIWNVDKITRAINNNIGDLCARGKNKNILVYDKKYKKYICKSIDSIGKVKNIKVGKRGSGGVVTQIIIDGSKRKIKVETQYTIRKVIGPYNASIIKNNRVKVNGIEMLPSSYFIVDKKVNNYVITGGGYGHGIGMSQCGVNELIKLGKSYDEVLKYYYNDTSIEYY